MSPALLFCILIGYFALSLGVARTTSRGADNDSFFIGNKSSNWMPVAFGMVGTTLSGATFISVPGAVGTDGFGYAQSMIVVILKLAGYTYDPLLGLFAFGMMTTRRLHDRLVPVVTVGAPMLCALLEYRQHALPGSFRLGLELLIVNGALVFAGLFAISRRATASPATAAA